MDVYCKFKKFMIEPEMITPALLGMVLILTLLLLLKVSI